MPAPLTLVQRLDALEHALIVLWGGQLYGRALEVGVPVFDLTPNVEGALVEGLRQNDPRLPALRRLAAMIGDMASQLDAD